ncbi:MAG: ABC transporter substrate-binding protein [Alphaproteobacteria bacterium CG_4_10_14_0_8_um_filter_37_21]|nr:MAG: ABC transporter substrate-binding protein [Alphaproteobacteria bacterium CG_4_10_14_0_8_um_filter_37_21]
MKRLFALTLIFGAIACVLFIRPLSHHHPKVGIIQYIEHPALDTARKGVIHQLKKDGFVVGENIEILYESAQGNPALAAQISQKLVGQKVDVIVALGTTPAQTALQNVRQQTGKSIPVVFASVSDPKEAKLMNIDQNGKLYGDMICGISDYVQPTEQFRMFKRVLPNMLNLGVIYNPGEINSVFTLGKMEKIASSFSLNIVSIPASKTADVIQAAQMLVEKVDAIFINNDNTALAAFDSISRIGTAHKVPVFVSDIELVEKAIATLGPDQLRIGEQAGEFVTALLKKEAKPRDLGVRFPEKVDLVLNKKLAASIGVSFSQDLEADAAQIIN